MQAYLLLVNHVFCGSPIDPLWFGEILRRLAHFVLSKASFWNRKQTSTLTSIKTDWISRERSVAVQVNHTSTCCVHCTCENVREHASLASERTLKREMLQYRRLFWDHHSLWDRRGSSTHEVRNIFLVILPFKVCGYSFNVPTLHMHTFGRVLRMYNIPDTMTLDEG